jgi:class 3 adenylate cyclase
MAEKTFHYSWEWQLQSSPEQLWPLASDTQNWNSITTKLAVNIAKEQSDGTRLIKSRNALVPLEWDEYPFEWVKPYRHAVLRTFRQGLIKELTTICTLTPILEGGTLARYEIIAKPANVIGSIVISLQVGRGSKAQFERAFKAMDAYVQDPKSQPSPYRSTEQFITSLKAQRLQEIELQLISDGYNADTVQELGKFLNTAQDDQIAHIRAYALADQWDAPRQEILELCLAATRRSLLDLTWEVVCPWCRGSKQSTADLGAINDHMHCPSCNEQFEVDFDHSIEVTFKPNASIRVLDVMDYCVGGPQITPHILAQQHLAPNESRTLNMAFEPGTHRVRTRSARDKSLNDHFTFRVSDMPDHGSHEIAVTANPQGWSADQMVVDAQTAITLINHTPIDQYFVIERMTWNDQSTSATAISTMQSFRDWFATQALRPEMRLGIANLSILFTDLQGSTQLYRQIGDAPAFGRVLEHFEVLRSSVKAHNGALVKTIGDAIMAVFLDPAQGVQAGLDILKRIPELNATRADYPFRLKLGLHNGPAIAVTLNDRLDYFGSTVNIAARLESQAQGEDLVVSNEVMNDIGVQQVLKDAGILALPFTAKLKGFIDEEFELYRIRLL